MPKAGLRIAAVGDVDEANSAIGVAIGAIADAALAARLTRIQNDLFDLGADIANPGDDFTPSEMVLRIVPAQVARLERELDAMNDVLAPLRSFVLPAGLSGAGEIHLARAIARRAERAAVALSATETVNPAALAYLNRLSDYLFVAARYVNHSGAGDVMWVPGASRQD